MNILILTTHLDPGGISRYVINLSKALCQAGHKVWVASGGGQWEKELSFEAVSFIHIPIKTKSIFSPKIFFSFINLRRFLKERKIDIIHCNTRVTQLLGFLLSKPAGVPYVSAFHGFYRPSAERKLFQFSGAMSIAVSNAVREHIIKDLWVKPEKVRVVYNGIDFKDFNTAESQRKSWGFKSTDYLIGVLGRISREKGHFLVVKALSLLARKHSNIYLIISGRGKMEANLKELIRNKSLEGRVFFKESSANQFLSSMDSIVVASEKEGFGYSIIEAFKKGVPVIGFNTGGISEIIRNRSNGLLFYSYDALSLAGAIEEMMLKNNLRSVLIGKAREDVEFFSAKRMAFDTEKVYREII
ncbi:MAG: glycosyltransferase family 4 protein [Candidatus Omnitrophica bacterium]|nr:glycosyltransferase family 4 protein [Candidatus Omnitrophota bacterium]MDD5429115.1 glycosyltransferase family 4 protein [Candidatus Omnitrophota bacterium]